MLADPRIATRPELVGDIGGTPAAGQLIPERGSLVAWSPEAGVTITAITRGTLAETLSFALTSTSVGEFEWAATGTVLPPRTEVGCDYFFAFC
jgi:hypothetical protein